MTKFWLKNYDVLDTIEAKLDSKHSEGKLDRRQSVKLVQDQLKSMDNGIKEQKTLIEQKLARYSSKIENTKQAQKVETNFSDILGYMPLRRDFDVEYDNEAELFLAEMEFDGRLE